MKELIPHIARRALFYGGLHSIRHWNLHAKQVRRNLKEAKANQSTVSLAELKKKRALAKKKREHRRKYDEIAFNPKKIAKSSKTFGEARRRTLVHAVRSTTRKGHLPSELRTRGTKTRKKLADQIRYRKKQEHLTRQFTKRPVSSGLKETLHKNLRSHANQVNWHIRFQRSKRNASS